MLFRQLLLPLQCRFERKWLFCDCKSNYFFIIRLSLGIILNEICAQLRLFNSQSIEMARDK